MKMLAKIDGLINKIEEVILVVMFLIMLVMAFGQVILRNFFSGGIIWGDILLRHLVLWIGFIGAALATSNDRHLNIEILRRFLRDRLRFIVAFITNIFAAAVCYFLFRASMTFLEFEIANKNIVYGSVPSWIAQLIIPAGYVLLIIHFCIRALVDLGKFWNKKEHK